MDVSSDIGFKNNVHLSNKKDVGKRLARWALSKTYHTNTLPSGPLPLQAKYENGKIIISFRYAGDKLLTPDEGSLKGFSIDGKNNCDAIIQNKTIVIEAKEKPAFVYYG